nr:MAG TPA: hypothetical protein [Caudoviricetes sp.]
MADIKIFGTLKSQTVEGAIAYSKEIVGGFMTLTQQERDSLNDVLKQDKMTIFCTTDNSYYRLENNIWVKVLEVTPPDVVLVSSTGTSGTLTSSQLAILRSNEDAKIKFEEEVYRLNDDKMDKGYLTYTHNSYISNVQWQKVITITISTMAWVLNTVKISDVDSKQLVTEVTTLGEPTKSDPYIVVKDEEVYRRNSVTEPTTPILYVPETGYHVYYIVKVSNTKYYIIWSKTDNFAIGYSSSTSQLYSCSIYGDIATNSYYTTATSENEAIEKITSNTTTYTKGSPRFTMASDSASTGTTVSCSVSSPFIKSNINSKDYYSYVTVYQYSNTSGDYPQLYGKTDYILSTQTNIPRIEGYFSDEVPTNSYKKLADKEYVDTKLDKVTTTTSANQAYVKNIDGSQGMIPIVQGVSGDSIPRRLADGRLQAKAGTNNDDVVNKKQMDDAIAAAITTALNTAV